MGEADCAVRHQAGGDHQCCLGSRAGFSLTGRARPVTLDPGQATSLDIRFDPTTVGAATEAVTLTTNTAAGTATVTLSGTGVAAGA